MTTTAKKMGVTFPVAPPGTGQSLLEACDPICAKLLDFFEAVINACLGDAVAASLAGGSDNGKGVAQKTCVDPSVWNVAERYSFPLLALYPISDEAADERTLQRDRTVTRYGLVWSLPRLTTEEAERVFPALPACRRLLIAALEKVVNAEYDNGASPFADTGVDKVTIGAARYGTLLYEDSPLGHPSLSMDVIVEHTDEWAETGEDLEWIKIGIGWSGTGDAPEEDDAVTHTDVAVPET